MLRVFLSFYFFLTYYMCKYLNIYSIYCLKERINNKPLRLLTCEKSPNIRRPFVEFFFKKHVFIYLLHFVAKEVLWERSLIRVVDIYIGRVNHLPLYTCRYIMGVNMYPIWLVIFFGLTFYLSYMQLVNI